MKKEPVNPLFDALDKNSVESSEITAIENLKSHCDECIKQLEIGPKLYAGGKIIVNRYVMASMLSVSAYLCEELLTPDQWRQFEEILSDAMSRLASVSARPGAESKLLGALQSGLLVPADNLTDTDEEDNPLDPPPEPADGDTVLYYNT